MGGGKRSRAGPWPLPTGPWQFNWFATGTGFGVSHLAGALGPWSVALAPGPWPLASAPWPQPDSHPDS